MNRLEYIPGDLVSVYVGIKKYIVEVIGTENENEVLSYQIKFQNGEIQYADKDNIVQIPLTPEILKKNGWKQNGGQYSFTYKPYAGDKVELIGFFIEMFKDVHDMLKHRYFQITHEDKVICGCFYVHQLQHLLFGLGINHEMEV
jgi:hypothetical protein